MKEQPLIETRNITKVFGMGDISVVAVEDVSLQIFPGEFIAIMGPSGSGKSTYLTILGCLSKPTSGQYLLDGQDVGGLSNTELAHVRNEKIGFIFQAYNLLPRTTALRNVTLPLLYRTKDRMSVNEGEEKAMRLLEKVGLSDRVNHQPQELSGGQQQRVAIARALVNDPLLIIADEPTGNLDSHAGKEIMDLLQDLHQQGVTIVMVTHDVRVAEHTHRIVYLDDGRISRIVQNGNAKSDVQG